MSAAFKWDKIFTDLTLDNKAKANTIHLKFKDQLFGPILPEELQEYVQYLKEENIYFREDDNEEWIPIVQHPFYQRRKPENVLKDQIPKDCKVHILKNGQKTGPFSYEEITEQVKDLKYLITDFVSFDSGKTWKKLCDFQEFDRRFYKHNHLPFTLEGQAPITIKHELIHKGEEEEIANVAYHEHHHQISDNQALNKLSSEQNLQSQNDFKIIYFIAFFIVIIFLFYLTLNKNDNLHKAKNLTKSNTSYTKNPTQSYKPKSKRMKMNQKKAKQVIKKTNNTVKQKSILNSRTFRNRYKTGEMKNEDIIDNGKNPYEQDQVQKMLSKETIYPEDFEDIEQLKTIPDEDDWVKRLEEQNRKTMGIDRSAELYYENEENDL